MMFWTFARCKYF